MHWWIDAQLPPGLASRLHAEFGVDAQHVAQLGLEGSSDAAIFERAREARAIVVTKDIDFVRLLERRGPPPQVLWLTIGNTTNDTLWQIVRSSWSKLAALVEAGEPLIQLDRPRSS